MITEWMALATVVLLLAISGAANAGAIAGSLAGFSVWLGVFAGYKLSRRINGEYSPLAYVYALAFTAVLRYLEIVHLIPAAGGFNPETDPARIVWPLVASLMVMAFVRIALRLRAARR